MPTLWEKITAFGEHSDFQRTNGICVRLFLQCIQTLKFIKHDCFVLASVQTLKKWISDKEKKKPGQINQNEF